MKQLIERASGNFYTQKIFYKNITDSRLNFFVDKISNRSTIHYGCADWPVYDQNTNLHLSLSNILEHIDGYDSDSGSIEMMIESNLFLKGSLFSTIPNKKYDFILIPETIEHVNNVETFLCSIIKNVKKNTEILITAPNAFIHNRIEENYITDEYCIELVHPDHNYWYSIYTLPNVIEKCFSKINKKVCFDEIGFLENKSMIYCLFKLN